jgi:5'-deoxynucleotidase YfbR-like HD superfamily hydrolase
MKSPYENDYNGGGAVDTIRFLIDGASVSRFHNLETIHRRTVADHSWGVAQLIFLLSEDIPRIDLVRMALSHDLAEQIVGDIPAPLKWLDKDIDTHLDHIESGILKSAGHPITEYLSKPEIRILQMADALEGMMCCVRERRLGNLNVIPVYQKWVQLFVDKYQPRATDRQLEIFFAVQELFGEADNG